jgi:hypothetical protein
MVWRRRAKAPHPEAILRPPQCAYGTLKFSPPTKQLTSHCVPTPAGLVRSFLLPPSLPACLTICPKLTCSRMPSQRVNVPSTWFSPTCTTPINIRSTLTRRGEILVGQKPCNDFACQWLDATGRLAWTGTQRACLKRLGTTMDTEQAVCRQLTGKPADIHL